MMQIEWLDDRREHLKFFWYSQGTDQQELRFGNLRRNEMVLPLAALEHVCREFRQEQGTPQRQGEPK